VAIDIVKNSGHFSAVDSRLTSETLTAFLPCRKGSERVPHKNTRPFSGVQEGLVGIKLRQLFSSSHIDHIVLSTDDPFIFELCDTPEFKSQKRFTILPRPAELALSSTTTDALIKHVADIISSGHILWTHVTSPFIGASTYDAIIKAYWSSLKEGYDSLMTVTQFQNFLWDENRPLNYDRSVEKWPRTQTLNPLHIINSGAFIAPAKTYKEQHDRVGKNPKLFRLDHFQELDIDRINEFEFCETLWPLKGGI